MSANFAKLFLLAAAALPTSLQSFNCPPISGTVGAGYDYFRSIPDGDWEGNTGALVDFNLSTPFRDTCGFQFGSSYGILRLVRKEFSPFQTAKKCAAAVFFYSRHL